MALTRKFLAALGIESEKIDEIIEAHTDTVNALKNERDEYKEDAEKLPALQAELNDLKEAMEKNKDNPYKEQYEDLKAEYDKYRQTVEAKETKQKKEAAYKALLKEAGVSDKRLASILKVSDVEAVEFDEDGKVKDADKLTESIKTEWADFIETVKTKGAETETPPAGKGNGGSDHSSRVKEIAQKYHENLYGKKGD